AGAGEHDAADLVVAFDGRPDAHQLDLRRLIDGVHAVGPVDGDARDVVLHREADGHDSTLSLRSSAIRSGAWASSPRISAPASPRLGGAWRSRNAEASMVMGEATSFSGSLRPLPLASSETIMLFAAVCSDASASPKVCTGAHRRSCSSSLASQCAVVSVESLLRNRRCNSVLFSTCLAKVAESGSAGGSGGPG